MTVTAIIPTAGHRDISGLLANLVDQGRTISGFEVIVVLNRSASAEECVPAMPGARVVTESTRGPSAARNAGARVALNSWLLFLDDDVELPNELLQACLAHGHDRPQGWAVFPTVETEAVRRSLFGQFRTAHVALAATPQTGPKPVDWLASAALLCDRERFLDLGGYSERFSAPGLEDVELAWRARAAGVMLFALDRPTVTHHDPRMGSVRQYCARQVGTALQIPLLQELAPASPFVAAYYGGVGPAQRARRSLLAVVGRAGMYQWLLGRLDAKERRIPRRARWMLYRAAIAAALASGERQGRQLAEKAASNPGEVYRV